MSALACMSGEAPRFLALEPVSFSTTAACSFSLSEGTINLPLYMKTISAGPLYRHKDSLESP